MRLRTEWRRSLSSRSTVKNLPILACGAAASILGPCRTTSIAGPMAEARSLPIRSRSRLDSGLRRFRIGGLGLLRRILRSPGSRLDVVETLVREGGVVDTGWLDSLGGRGECQGSCRSEEHTSE